MKTIVNGYSYTVMDFDSATVSLKVFPQYAKKEEAATEADDEADDEGDDEPVVDPNVFTVDHEFFMKHFRMPFALPICYAQGRTYKDKKVLLMDVHSPHYTMRHLIVGVSRVNNGSNLWIAPPGYGKHIRDTAQNIYEARKRGDSSAPGEQHFQRMRRQWSDDEADARMMEESDSE